MTINARERIRSLADIDGDWKIAAIQKDAAGDKFYWFWFSPDERAVDAMRRDIHTPQIGATPRLSACRGRQMVDGIERLCLYVRMHPHHAAGRA